METRMVARLTPPRKGRAAKTRANRSFSEEEVEMIELLEEEFPETLLLDPASPPKKLSMKSRVILKRIDVAKAGDIHKQVVILIITIMIITIIITVFLANRYKSTKNYCCAQRWIFMGQFVTNSNKQMRQKHANNFDSG